MAKTASRPSARRRGDPEQRAMYLKTYLDDVVAIDAIRDFVFEDGAIPASLPEISPPSMEVISAPDYRDDVLRWFNAFSDSITMFSQFRDVVDEADDDELREVSDAGTRILQALDRRLLQRRAEMTELKDGN